MTPSLVMLDDPLAFLAAGLTIEHLWAPAVLKLKSHSHGPRANLGHSRVAFSGWEHQVAYDGWIRALVTMATSYPSSSAAAIFYPKECFVHTGGLLWNGRTVCFSSSITVRIPSSGREIRVSEGEKCPGSVASTWFLVYYSYCVHKVLRTLILERAISFSHSWFSLGKRSFPGEGVGIHGRMCESSLHQSEEKRENVNVWLSAWDGWQFNDIEHCLWGFCWKRHGSIDQRRLFTPAFQIIHNIYHRQPFLAAFSLVSAMWIINQIFINQKPAFSFHTSQKLWDFLC